jgi:group I intron endonuclease
MWKIYIIRNTINTKTYVGITNRSPYRRFIEHCNCKTSVVGNAIRKYGRENFLIESLDVVDSLNEALEKETEYINIFKSSVHENGYNLIETSTVKEYTSEMKINLTERLKKLKRQKNPDSFIGVFFIKSRKCWAYSLNINGTKGKGKGYKNNKDAALHRDSFIVDKFSKDYALKIMNFPELYELLKTKEYNLPQTIKNINSKKSVYRGVYFEKKFNKWRVRIDKNRIKNPSFYLTSGLLEDEKKAAERADYVRVCGYYIENDLNFPENLSLYKSLEYIPPPTTIEHNKKIKYKNISFDGRRYSVYVRSNHKVYRTSTKKLEDAVEKRNEFYKIIGKEI